MAYIQGFTYVSGPLFIREFNLNSAATVAAWQPVTMNGAGDIIESSATNGSLAGFIMHRAVDSVPAGKCLVMVPGDGRTIFAAIANTGIAASAISSGVTCAITKSGNSFKLTAASVSSGTALFVVVPREDGTTIDSTDSSVWVQALGTVSRPFNQASATVTL